MDVKLLFHDSSKENTEEDSVTQVLGGEPWGAQVRGPGSGPAGLQAESGTWSALRAQPEGPSAARWGRLHFPPQKSMTHDTTCWYEAVRQPRTGSAVNTPCLVSEEQVSILKATREKALYVPSLLGKGWVWAALWRNSFSSFMLRWEDTPRPLYSLDPFCTVSSWRSFCCL